MPTLMAVEAVTLQTLSSLLTRTGSSFMCCSSVAWRETTVQRRCLVLLVSLKSLPCGEHSNPSGLSSLSFGDGHMFHDVPFDLTVGHKVQIRYFAHVITR